MSAMQPGIILLREGTDTSQGKPQLISNINACSAIADTVATTLGPRGMDKLIYEDKGKAIISNDGATIMKQLDIVHPAAQTLVDIAKSQDSEVGDGTTSVVLLAAEFLKEAKNFIEEGVHPQVIIRAYRKACIMAKERIKELSVTVEQKSGEELRNLLQKCAETALNSKLISSHKQFFSKMIVDAVMTLDEDLDISMIGIKKEQGGSLEDSFLVQGVAFKKTFSYAGFEQQPKKIPHPKILLLNLELELKSEKDNAEIRINDVATYQKIVDAEWRIIYEKLENIVKSGAKIVLSRLAIGDLATQYFADREIFCAGRVTDDDLKRVAKATGGAIQTSVNNLNDSVLGSSSLFEEVQVGGERYNLFTGCNNAKSATIVLRGGGEAFNDEAERSMQDAIMIVRRARKHSSVVAGGGAIEMEILSYLRSEARKIQGKQQLLIEAFAKALEIIPRQIADNCGFNSNSILNKLRTAHKNGEKWIGVDVVNEDVCDTFNSFVWEPTLVKLNGIQAATEAACLILSVDETVRAPKNEPEGSEQMGGRPPMGRGRRGPRKF